MKKGFTLIRTVRKNLIGVRGFTLIELLVVISIIGVLVTIALVSFRSSQARGRDAERKSDLKQIASALELYYSDYGKYPSASVDGAGYIAGCPSNLNGSCTWGSKEFTDGKTTYFKLIPKDPVSADHYFYRTVTVNSSPNSGFQIYALLENLQDASKISTNVSCGPSNCNFGLSSPNTSPIATP